MPRGLHREHHRQRPNRSIGPKLSDEDATKRSDRSRHGHLQVPLFDQHRCSTQDDAFRKESDVSTPPPSVRGTRGFLPSRGVVVRSSRYLNEASEKGSGASSVVLVVDSRADQGFPPVPCPQHQPACPTSGSGEQGCHDRDQAGGRTDQAGRGLHLEIRNWGRRAAPAPPQPSAAASTPPARPGRGREHATAAARRRVDAVRAVRGRRPGEPGPNQGSHRKRPSHLPPPPSAGEADWRGARREESLRAAPVRTSAPQGRLPPYDLAGCSARRSPPPPSQALRAFAGNRLRGRRGRGKQGGETAAAGVRVSPLPSP
jgi:hypothetical protein